MGTLGIVLLDTLILWSGVYYYFDDIHVLYPVAVHSLETSFWPTTRPLQYLVVQAANNVYLPLWLGASLLCVVGATVLSGLACERLFERRLPRSGWWILGLANPLLFYLVSQPDVVSQALCNLLFAGALLAFVIELDRLRGQMPSGWRADRVSVFLNFMAAALFFTKETGVAAAIVLPAATALMRLKARRLSPIFLVSLLLSIVAAGGWFFLKLKYQSILPTHEGRYGLSLNPIIWGKNIVVTFAFPITPLPSSFIGFELLRSLWIIVSLGSILFFFKLILQKSLNNPRIIFPLIVIFVSCAPMILIRTDELYPTMIGPFVVSVILLFLTSRMRRLSLVYGLLLYVASLGNAIIYSLGADFNLLGLQRLQYSIYGKDYQRDPICPILTTAHVAWDGPALPHVDVSLDDRPRSEGKITCIR
jgi:hypothetical protein